MCGIAGIVAPAAENYRPHLDRMVRALAHRGPDDRGTHFFAGCALGHTRLSIVDLAGGHQPMLSADTGTGIVFNGEIYGYRDLRRALDGHAFHTDSDTEVILALHERHGDALPAHLPGMFAFALWDDRTRTLLCARDRFGEKPLYYATGEGGEFIFASEIKAILAAGLIAPEIDPAAVRHYLRRGFVHTTQTIYRNIHTLPPAHALTWHDGHVEVRRYWSLPAPRDAITLRDATNEFRRLFEQSIGRQLVADVPVGAFLSGGLDSSTIVAAAAQQSAKVRTFSFGFGDSIDELPYAREIAQRYGTDHTELTDDADVAELLVEMQRVYDEPFGDSSNIPVWLLSRQARRHITVALAGEGGDELTGGYDFWYRPAFNLERALHLPRAVSTLLRAAAAACKLARRPLPRTLAGLWEGFFLREHHASPLELHSARTAFFSDAQLTTLGFPGSTHSRPGDLDTVLRADLTDYLPGDVLVKTDRASMAHGLEIRCPFLDVDFASFCLSLPTRLKLDPRSDKLILRAAFADAWTPAIRARRKQGFGAPVTDWLRRPTMRALADAAFGNPRARLYDHVSREAAREFITAGNQQTWLLLVLALWLEEHA